MKSVSNSCRVLADVTEASSLNYTILHPDWFTNGNKVDHAIPHKGGSENGTTNFTKKHCHICCYAG